jgi:hypothetical protein
VHVPSAVTLPHPLRTICNCVWVIRPLHGHIHKHLLDITLLKTPPPLFFFSYAQRWKTALRPEVTTHGKTALRPKDTSFGRSSRVRCDQALQALHLNCGSSQVGPAGYGVSSHCACPYTSVGTHLGNMVRHGESLVRGARQWRKQATQFALWTHKAHIMGRNPLLSFRYSG